MSLSVILAVLLAESVVWEQWEQFSSSNVVSFCCFVYLFHVGRRRGRQRHLESGVISARFLYAA